MKFNYALDLHPQVPSPASVGADVRDQIEMVRDTRFDAVVVGEHHATGENYLLNEAVLAYAAAEVDMHVMTGVILLPYHNPVRIAEYGATMDVLTDGKFILGVGQGYRPEEYRLFGVDRKTAPGRLTEGVEVIERLWQEDEVTYRGEYFDFESVTIEPKPVQDPRPSIHVAASNERSVRRAAEIGDAWFGAHAPLHLLSAFADAYYDEVGDDGVLGIHREVFVGETDAAAEAAMREPLERFYQKYVEWGQSDVFEHDTFEAEWENLKENRFIIGSPDTVAAEIERYRRELDLDYLTVKSQRSGLTVDDVRSSTELLDEAVIPRFT